MKKSLVSIVACAAAVCSSALVWGGDGSSATVYMVNRTFDQNNPDADPPTNLPLDPTITVGGTVTWVIYDGVHSIVSAEQQAESWDSGFLFEFAESFAHTFTHAGDFTYYCGIHGSTTCCSGEVSGMSGVVHVLPPAQCSPADVGVQGGTAGHDNLLDNNDFVVFISLFFGLDPAADVGQQGGLAGGDTLFDNNDFVVFIDFFFDDQAVCTG